MLVYEQLGRVFLAMKNAKASSNVATDMGGQGKESSTREAED